MPMPIFFPSAAPVNSAPFLILKTSACARLISRVPCRPVSIAFTKTWQRLRAVFLGTATELDLSYPVPLARACDSPGGLYIVEHAWIEFRATRGFSKDRELFHELQTQFCSFFRVAVEDVLVIVHRLVLGRKIPLVT